MGEELDSLRSPIGLLGDPRRERARRGRFFGVAGVSLAAHLAGLIAVLLMGTSAPRLLPPPAPVAVGVVAFPRPPAASPPPAPARPSPPKPPPPASLFRPTKAPAPQDLPVAKQSTAPDAPAGLTGAELAGAATAGSGSGAGAGGACDMASRVQEALRRDPLVQAATAPLGGKAVMIWNGDWVWLPGEDGRGLKTVRQAMMWEIAFSPSECRGQTMHGLVVLSPNEANGSARLAVGEGVWRWSDLLTPHPGSGSEQAP
jgi:hypothetical protein